MLIRLRRAITAFRKAFLDSIAESRSTDRQLQERDRRRTFQTGLMPFLFQMLALLCFGASWWFWSEFGAVWGLAALALYVGLLWVAMQLANRTQRKKQAARNATASAIVHRLLNGENVAFSLFLHPFSSSGKLGTLISDPGKEDLFSSDLETTIAKALEPEHPLIGIGTHGEVGSGKITPTDEEWKKDFEFLAHTAHLVFAVPGLSISLRWEFQRLITEGMIPKCVFIMPATQRKSREPEWREVQDAWRDYGLQLPAFDPNGCLFRILPNGASERICSFRKLEEADVDLILWSVSVGQTLKNTYRMQAEMREKFREVFGREPNEYGSTGRKPDGVGGSGGR